MSRRVILSLALVFLVELSQSQPDKPDLVQKFASILSGHYSNIEQVNSDRENGKVKVHDLINATWKPVLIPSLAPAVTLFHEEVLNNIVNRLQIYFISQKDDRIIIHPLSISTADSYKPGEFEKKTDFNNVKLQETEVEPDCVSEFVQTEESEFAGTIPDCQSGSPGDRAKFAIFLSCRSFAAAIYWKVSRERTNVIPYEFKKLDSYPLLPYMLEGVDNFQPPCDTTK